MRRCYIVVRQDFFLSHSVHYQIADDNPVVEVFTTAEAAKDFVRGIISRRLKYSNLPLHMVEENIDSELIYKAGSFDSSGHCDCSYNVIKKGMMV